MKINNFIIVNLLNMLQGFGDKRLPQRISYAITKNLMIINKEYDIYVSQLNKVLDKYDAYSEKDEKGQRKTSNQGLPIITDSVQRENFNRELNDLLSIEIDLKLFTIKEECFDYDDSDMYDPLTPSEIIALQNILCNSQE